MSATGVRIFGCPTCGFRVDTNEESCPRCGNVFQKGTMFECPFCGDLVPSGLDECPSCHVSYSEFKARAAPKATDDSIDALLMEIIRLESASVKEEEKKFSCPQCDLLLEGTETRCPRCGRDLDVEVALQCPVCGALVGAKDVKCGECGIVFDEVSASAASTEEAQSKLDEIMSITWVPEPEAEPPAQTPRATSANEDERDVEVVSSTLVKPQPSARVEPERRPTPKPQEVRSEEEWEPKPVPEPVPEPAPTVSEAEPIEPAPEQVSEPEPTEPVSTPAPKKAPSGGGKKKTRKLKAKPKQ